MRIQLIFLLSICFGATSNFACAQSNLITKTSEISLITCGPGTDLYATFGHSAIHILDRSTGIDRVYNYGTFDFNTPNFYLKFARGKLKYMLSVSSILEFLRVYQYEGRWVYRQQLNLNLDERRELFAFLENNAKPQNRYYKYDFFYDNCSTRIRDVLETVLGNKLKYPENPLDSIQTFRDLIGLYLTNHPWSDLGIDLALGAPCDQVATWRQKMFLPNYLKSNLEQTTLVHGSSEAPLLQKGSYILAPRHDLSKPQTSGILWIFWAFFALVALSTPFVKARYFRGFDIPFFALIGLLGIFIALLWFATDHSATKWNYNLLWATPTWILGAILLIRKAKPNTLFFKIHTFLMIGILVFWILIPQNLHPAVIPLTLALMMRSWAWRKRKPPLLNTI